MSKKAGASKAASTESAAAILTTRYAILPKHQGTVPLKQGSTTFCNDPATAMPLPVGPALLPDCNVLSALNLSGLSTLLPSSMGSRDKPCKFVSSRLAILCLDIAHAPVLEHVCMIKTPSRTAAQQDLYDLTLTCNSLPCHARQATIQHESMMVWHVTVTHPTGLSPVVAAHAVHIHKEYTAEHAVRLALHGRYADTCSALVVGTADGTVQTLVVAGEVIPTWAEQAPACITEGRRLKAIRSEVSTRTCSMTDIAC